MLDNTQRERYSRFLALRDVSEDDLESILQSTVSVVGAGGLGSPVLRLLTAFGFGNIRIIDHDVVDLSNLQRQTIYETDDIGSPKAETAASNLSRLNPDVSFEPYAVSIRDENAIKLLSGSDVILDGLDSIAARRAVNRASFALNTPYVYAGAIEHYGNISTFIPGKTGCLHCLIGDLDDDSVAVCADVGVMPTLLSVIGAIEVQEAISIVTGKQPSLATRLMHVDMQEMIFDSFHIEQNKACPICSISSEFSISKTKEPYITFLCSGSYSVSPVEMTVLNLDDLTQQLDPKTQYELKKGFLRIHLESGVTLTIMKTGNAVIRGVNTKDEALKTYMDIMRGNI